MSETTTRIAPRLAVVGFLVALVVSDVPNESVSSSSPDRVIHQEHSSATLRQRIAATYLHLRELADGWSDFERGQRDVHAHAALRRLHPLVDWERIGARISGNAWSRADAQQRERFLDALQRHLLAQLAARLQALSDWELRFAKAPAASSRLRVRARRHDGPWIPLVLTYSSSGRLADAEASGIPLLRGYGLALIGARPGARLAAFTAALGAATAELDEAQTSSLAQSRGTR